MTDKNKVAYKAVLLSALVFPGLGQLVMKRYKTGIAIIAIVTVCLLAIISIALERAKTILEQLQIQGMAVDLNAVTQAAHQATATADNSGFTLSLWFIIVSWVYSVVDAWRASKRQKALPERTTP